MKRARATIPPANGGRLLSTMTIDAFISRLSNLEGEAELANHPMLLSDLADVIEVPRPVPARATTEANQRALAGAVRRTNDSTRSVHDPLSFANSILHTFSNGARSPRAMFQRTRALTMS